LKERAFRQFPGDEPRNTQNARKRAKNGHFFILLSVKILFFCANFLPVLPGDVAQISILLYRRIACGWVPCAAGSSGLATTGGLQIRDTAECNSALLRLRLRRAGAIRG